MRRLLNWITAIWLILMITGLFMNNDAGIVVASIGMICAFIGFAIKKVYRLRGKIGR